jgi:hypothetical protein
MPRRIYLPASNPVDPACASIEAFQKALRVREDKLTVITAIGQDFDAIHPEDRSNWYEYDFPVTVSATPSALELRPVPANAVNDLTAYKAFLLPLLSNFSLVDVAILDLGGNQTEVVLLRPDGVNQPPGPGPLPADLPPLPDFVADVLSAAKGVPWSQAKALPSMDNYIGALPGRFRLFPGLQGPQGVAMTAIYYECRFTIDSDGTGTDAGDHSHKQTTSLRLPDGNSLNASTMHFAVIPMDDIEALKEHMANLSFPQKQAGLPNFGADLGLKLGDVGVAFWRENASGAAQQAFFIYGDKGRPNELGEGSMLLAKDLGMSDNPNNGGHTATEVTNMGKGIVHIGFPGSGQQFLVAGSSTRSNLVPDHIEDTARKFFAAFLSQPAAPTDILGDLISKVQIPASINNGLTSGSQQTMLKKFGKPGELTSDCSQPNASLENLLVRNFDVGPFKVTGMKAAANSLKQVFDEVKTQFPQVFREVRTDGLGMLCVRQRRSDPTQFSNHSWGTAIDLKFGPDEVAQGTHLTQRGFLSLFPVFNRFGWFWGAGFSGDAVDSMHFELAEETILKM